MFNQVVFVALIVPMVYGLQLATPTDWRTSSPVTASWTNQAGDQTIWSLELVNIAFNNQFAIANNVDPSVNNLNISLPSVPVGDGYTLNAVNIANISDVFATSGTFSIQAALQPSTTLSSASSSATGPVVITAPSPSFGTTVSRSASGSASSTASSASSSNTGAPFNAGVSNMKFGLSSNAGALAVMLLSAVAGAVAVL